MRWISAYLVWVCILPILATAAELTLTEHALPAHEKEPGFFEYGLDVVQPLLDSLHWRAGTVPDTVLKAVGRTALMSMPKGTDPDEIDMTSTLKQVPWESDRGAMGYDVVIDDSVVYRFYENAGDGPSLRRAPGEWVLTVSDLKLPGDSLEYGVPGRGAAVIVNGHNLNAERGYSETFDYHYISGKPVYFFRKAGRFGMVADGVERLLDFEKLPHNQCCEPSIANPWGLSDRIGFFGYRKGVWYWVDARFQ